MKSIRQVIYISQASRPLRDEEIDELVATASRNNRQHGVTGALLFIENSFVQVLEGEDQEIAELLSTIAADSRHTNMRILADQEIDHRNFSDWSMALVKPEHDDRPGVAGEVRSTMTQVDEDASIVVPLPHTISMMQRLYETDAALQRARSH